MTTASRRVLIAGCGDLGRRIGLLLADAGCSVWGLRRNAGQLLPPLQPLRADLTRPETLTGIPPGLDVLLITIAAQAFGEQAYRTAYVEGPRNLLQALGRSQNLPRRVLFTSSSSVYAQSDGAWVDENSETVPGHFSGRILLEAENLMRQEVSSTIVLRLAGIYGPGRRRLIDQVVRGEATCVEAPPQYTNRIHVDDAARLAVHLLEEGAPAGVYLGVDDEPAEQCRVLRWLARELGVPEPRVVETSTARERGRRSNKRCSNAKIAATGFRFVYPTYREGYAALLAGQQEESP